MSEQKRRSIWNGSISFGLVTIPVKMYAAVEESIQFRLLCKEHHSPIEYERKCVEGRETVAWKNIEKGFELQKGEFIPLSQDTLKSLRPESTDTVKITEFIDRAQIDPLHVNTNYFVVPQQETSRAYYLLKDVLARSALAGIGKVVIRGKEHVVAISAYKEGLLLTTLYYPEQILTITDIPGMSSRSVDIAQEERRLALDLINRMFEPKFALDEYRDTFGEEIRKIVAARKGVPLPQLKKEEERSSVETKNLVDALKASMEA